MSEVRKMAESHWEFIKKLLDATLEPATEREHVLYVEAMVHGHKHGIETKEEYTK